MDSLTQLVLGASISVAVMGRRTAVWKAALWGGVAGTLPDLDALIDHGDAIVNMVLHRAESHSLLFLTLLAPLMGALAARLHGQWQLWRSWSLALWAALFTHPLLDWMTVYGTQLLQPFTDHPYAVGSVFIIDPGVTLPMLLGLILALCLSGGRGLRWNLWGLALALAYLLWSVFAQNVATQTARQDLQARGLVVDKLLVTPAPLNTLLWRVVAITPEHHWEGHTSLLDDKPQLQWRRYERGADLLAQHGQLEAVRRVAAFSQGFYRLRVEDGRLLLTDLRMGQEPGYVFTFDLGPQERPGEAPAVQVGFRTDVGESLRWLWRRMWGQAVLPPGVDAP
jgi:inner membrane protein